MFLKPNKLTDFTDRELISRYKDSRDNTYIGELFQRYTHLVFGVCMKYLKNEENSKDAVMEIFEKLLKDLKKHDVTNFKSWLYSVAKNFCLMQFREKKSILKKEETYKKSNPEIMELVNDLHLYNGDNKEKQIDTLQEAMGQLNSEQKQCVELFYLQEKSYNEVVKLTGYT